MQIKQVSKTKQKKDMKKLKESAVTTSTNELVGKVLKLMRKHIGENNRISRRSLFTRIYDAEPEMFSELQEYLLWDLLKRAMHRCRQQTQCFIVSKLFKESSYSAKDKIGGVWYYWVAEDVSDFHIYRNNINRNINAMRRMVNRCERAVDRQWHKEDWLSAWDNRGTKK